MKINYRCCRIATILVVLLSFCKVAHLETSTPSGLAPELDQMCLAEAVSKAYKVPIGTSLRVVQATERYSSESFPKQSDLLAIIAVESTFKPLSKSLGNYGLMQVNLRSHPIYSVEELLGIESGVRAGSRILTDMYKSLRDIRGAVVSYNIGIFGYKKGRDNPKYYASFKRNRALIQERVKSCTA
jgi:soluble lytic murein transglycosylase-like protein